MKKKTIGILLMISLVMIISIGAISAADTNDTLLEQVSDTNGALQVEAGDADIATASVAFENDNATSLASETGNDNEIDVNDNQDELSNQKGGDASSTLNEGVLSASNDDVLKASSGSFLYNGVWYDDLDDAVDEACDNGGGEIKIRGGTYGSDSDDVKISISKGVTLRFSQYDSGQVIFDGSKNDKWFFDINDDNARVTFDGITFRNGGAFQGGAIEVDEGHLNLYNCIFEGNKAFQNKAGGYGWGGAIYLDDDECSLIAKNCRFINNNAASGGGAVCVEGDGSKAEFYDCYFEGNKQGDEENDVYDKDSGTHEFSNCSFVGHGSIEFTVDSLQKSVEITPYVYDEVNQLVLYHYGEFYREIDCISGSTKTFTNLEDGSYTIYMKYYDQKRFIYKSASFRIVANDFVLNDEQVFESLSAAVAAIPNGGTGVITVNGGIYTEVENFNVKIINNKNVTIKPKDDSLEDVIFSANSEEYSWLEIQENCHLTMEDITITGNFGYGLRFERGSTATISGCEFKNIFYDEIGEPINMWHSNVVLNDCTFESNKDSITCRYSTLNINDCTFADNSAYHGGAINAWSSNLTVTGSKFIGNKAYGKGGAIYADNLKAYDTEFIGNSAETGGAIYISNANSIINITDCVFDSNIADNYRNIYSESTTRESNLQFNEYDLNLTLKSKDDSYGREYILEGTFDWGSNLNNNYTVLAGLYDDEIIFGDLLTIEDNKFKINGGVLSAGSHNVTMAGMYLQGDRMDYFYGHEYYSDLYGNEFYLNNIAFAKILIDKAKITLNLDVKSVSIPETPVLNVYADWDLNYTIFIGDKYYQLEVVNGKGSMQLTGLDLGNYSVVCMRNADENYELVMNFTTFSINKTYSNFLVLSTNVEYDTLGEAVANSNKEDTIYVKKGTYAETGVVISDKVLDIHALDGAVFDAQGHDANFIIINRNAVVEIYGITFRGLHNRNTNYGAIVNHGYLSLDSCNFTDNKITKTSFAENGGAAIFSDGNSLDIDNCNFINNVAPLKVGTAAVTSVGYEDISITSSKFINNSAREGGALHFKNIIQFESAITSCDFEHNTAVKGSAIYVGNDSKYLSVTLSDFRKNDIKNNLGENAQLEGGVIYVNANTSDVILDIDSSNFEDNSNSNVDGGVICLDGSSKATIGTCIFNNNSGKIGSVILIKNPYDKKLTLVIDGSGFINNSATNGAIATSPKVTTLIDECVFANNTGENRHIYSNGFTVVHDSIFDVKDIKLNALSVQYGENSVINGTADIGTNIYAEANLTVADENILMEIKNNTFTYKTGILSHGKYYAVLNSIADNNNNTYLMDSITEIFRVNRVAIEFNVSVDNITYGETLKVTETLPSQAIGTIDYQLNGRYYTKDEIESLKLGAGKYALVAFYDHEDFAFTSSVVNFEVYKANPTISVADVEVEYKDSIILNIETNVPSIYIIEIEDYKNIVFVNGSRSIEIDNAFNPGSYTINVTSQERVNYTSNSTEAILKVNEPLSVFNLGVSENTYPDDGGIGNAGGNNPLVDTSNNNLDQSLMASSFIMQSANDDNNENINNLRLTVSNVNNENILTSLDNSILGDEEEEGNFIYQYDEDSDYEYYDTLEDAIAQVELSGAGIITVRGGTYSGDEFCGIYLEGEMELTIKAYEGEEVIFDCGNANYFLHLTYETVTEPIETPPYFEIYQTEGPTVTLDHITVINGYAVHGGAIDIDAGTLILANCTFSNNNAKYGGAIYIGSVTADEDAMVIGYNTTFTNNYASDEGGAVYIASGMQDTSASFYACTFLDNYQGENENKKINYFAGGAADDIKRKYCIFNGNGTIYSVEIDKINQTVTVNGTSTDPFESVVLLYFDQAPLYSIDNKGLPNFYITFEDVIGGNYTLGVMDDHDYNTYVFENKFEMIVPNFIISEDEVYENLTDAIDAVRENGIIYANANYYTEDNMEIDIRKSFTLKNFRDNPVVFDGSGEKWFFTIDEGCTVEFDNIYFTDGAVKTRAAIENLGNLILNNCLFDSFEIGAIIYNSGVLNILNSEFSLNSVNNALVWNDEDLVIDTVEFSNNIVNISSVVYNNGAAEIISSNFTGNFNLGNGGAIYSTNSLSVKDTVFNENEGFDGGAVYSTGTLTVLNSTFEDNTANGYGGAIYNGNEANIFNSTFTGGCSEKDGGAIYNNNVMTVFNSTFVGNTATGNGSIYNNRSLTLTESFFGINFAEECANIYNAGEIQFSGNTFDFYDVILDVPDGQYGINTTITGTLNPEFNMDLKVTLPGFVNNKNANVTISDGIFEYITDILPKGVYDVKLDEVIYDIYGNIYLGEAVSDRLIIHKANVYINLTVDDVVLHEGHEAPLLKISTSKIGLIHILFNNRLFDVNITDEHTNLTLDAVGEGNYSVLVIREGDENYNDAVNETRFTVSEYLGNFIVNSTGGKYDTLDVAIRNSAPEDIIYVMEGTYSGFGYSSSGAIGKKLSIIALGDVVFDQSSTSMMFLSVDENADITVCDIVFTGFNAKFKWAVFLNRGNLTIDGCTFVNNTLEDNDQASTFKAFIYNEGNLNIVDSEFYDNTITAGGLISSQSQSNLIVNESRFENNTFNGEYRHLIEIVNASSVEIISSVFAENILKEGNIIFAENSTDVLISSAFYNNTQDVELIYACENTNLLVDNSIFTGNNASQIIASNRNTQSNISCTFTENTVENVVLSNNDKNLSVLESTFSDNTISGYGALNIASEMNAIVNGSVFTNNKANNYRNIYSVCDVNITNSVFDALNVDYTVYDIDYEQTETIEGTIDIGTNLNFTVNLDINSNDYSVNVTDNEFTYNSGIIGGGDYKVVLNAKDNNSNTYVFDKITKMFTVNRIDPGLSVSIANVTQGEKLEVNSTISKNVTARVFYEVNGNAYSKNQLENLTLDHGNYLVTAIYRGDKNYLPATVMVNVEVRKVAPNITVSDVSVDYGDEIKVNVTADVADYYTVFIGNESVSLYDADSAIFTFSSENFKVDSYEITVYVFESDDYAEAYAYATLTVNKAVGVFNLSSEIINPGENATIAVEVPVNAYGNITYIVYDMNKNPVYIVTQSCMEKLVVPNLGAGRYNVTGTYEGDSYYTNESIINSCEIFVRKGVGVNITVSNITYGENATVIVWADVDGDYLVYVGNQSLLVTVIGGAGCEPVSNLAAGIYVANVTIVDGNYSAFNETVFEVFKGKSKVEIDFESATSGAAPVTVKLPADAGGNVTVYVNGVVSKIVRLVNGSAVITVPNLIIGNNIVKLVYSGDDNYDPFTKSIVINRKSTIIASGMTRGYNSGLDYTAKLLDDKGSPLANAKVTIKVDTIVYTVKTDSNGVFKFNKKLAVGNHAVVIVNPVTREYKLTNLKIVKRITGNKNVAIFFADGSNYKVRIIGDNGKYVGAGKVVKINVAGKTYSVKTNKKGYANLKLSLKVKKYTITVKYKGFTTKNKVTVKSVLKPVKKTVKVKKTARKLKIKVKLKGKKVLKNKKVYMKFRGKTYTAKTNKNGVATFKVPKKVIKKLKKGRKYKAVFTYKAKANGKTIKTMNKCYVKVR